MANINRTGINRFVHNERDMEDEQNILIDQLEDQLIDNPDASTTKQLSESSYDETFQKKLNERADQFFNASQGGKWKQNGTDEDSATDFGGPGSSSYYQFLITKSYLDFQYQDHGDLQQEISEWFTSSDYELIGLHDLPKSASLVLDPAFNTRNFNMWTESQELDSLVNFAFGDYALCLSTEEQVAAIQRNSELIMELLFASLVPLLQAFFEECDHASNENSKQGFTKTFSANYFKVLTIVYFVANAALCSNRNDRSEILRCLEDSNLLISIVVFIGKWKRHPNHNHRIRNVLLLLWKLILLEFGGSAQLQKVDDYLVAKHGIRNKDRKNAHDSRLTCSPLDYFTFKEDLMDKYPMFTEPPPETTNDTGTNGVVGETHQTFMAMNSFSNSLSNLLEMPRTNKAHTILGQLPIQTLHIATPVPSPPSTPSDFMSGGEKIRKLYHVNQGMPFIYPNNGKDVVPEAISEADKLLGCAVYESYSIKRLWVERQRYMKQERGCVDQYEDHHIIDFDEFEYDESLNDGDNHSHESEIRSLLRVEEFYSKTLVHLHALVEVLVEIVKSNKFDFSLKDAEQELDSETSFSSRFSGTGKDSYNKVQTLIFRQLEMAKVKEITLKACSSIMSLLLKWFKVNHVLKYYYFSSLLFDQQYLSVFIDFMANSFNNVELQLSEEETKSMAPYEILSTQNKLMNPPFEIPQFDFFNCCLGRFPEHKRIDLINRTTINQLPSIVDESNQNIVHISAFNKNFAFILTNLLNVTNKILIKNISQRIFALNETKPTDLLKIVLLNYLNDALKVPILKIFKKLIPYQGRKWRALNMDVISQIYLNLKLSLKDNWLSGKDLESDFNNSFDQEIALRSLLQFYNIRKYPTQMESLGYSLTTENIPTIDFEESWIN